VGSAEVLACRLAASGERDWPCAGCGAEAAMAGEGEAGARRVGEGAKTGRKRG